MGRSEGRKEGERDRKKGIPWCSPLTSTGEMGGGGLYDSEEESATEEEGEGGGAGRLMEVREGTW